jgi:thioredoxin-like negative regulator of GroEL
MTTRRRLLAAAAALAVAGALAAPLARAAGAAFDRAAFDAALAAGGPVLVEISAPWCPTCRAQKAILADLLARPDHAGYAAFDVDFDNQKDVVRGFGAQSQSTLIVFKGGAEVGRSVGDATPEGVAKLLAAAL